MRKKEYLIDKYEAYNQMSLSEMIRSDVQAWGKASIALTKLGFYSSFFYRIYHSLYLNGISFPAKCLQIISQVITSAEISHKAIIGPGLRIFHPIGVHIGPNVKIGAYACICECSAVISNTIHKEVPIVGDYLWMSSGAKIMGAVVAGDRVRIGPNSVLLKNINSNMIAFGVPARIMPTTFHKKNKPIPTDFVDEYI